MGCLLCILRSPNTVNILVAFSSGATFWRAEWSAANFYPCFSSRIGHSERLTPLALASVRTFSANLVLDNFNKKLEFGQTHPQNNFNSKNLVSGFVELKNHNTVV